MRIRYISLVVVLVTLGFGVGRLSAGSGTLDSPDVPANTLSYTLEDIYNRLDTGAPGAQSTFTEPGAGPGTGTMHILNDIYDLIGERAAVPKTGQTKCYTAAADSEEDCPEDSGGYPGQDGDHQKGVTWPNPRFTVSGDTVTDNLTGLIWLKDANCIKTHHGTYNFDNDGTAGDGAVTWQHALDFVAGINAGTYSNCGGPHTDWRLPNRRELLSLIHHGLYDPAVPNTAGTGQWSAGDPFNNVPSGRYWSSTTCAGAAYTNYAGRVDMKQGNTTLFTKTSVYYVWPVRGGQ